MRILEHHCALPREPQLSRVIGLTDGIWQTVDGKIAAVAHPGATEYLISLPSSSSEDHLFRCCTKDRRQGDQHNGHV